MQRARAFDLFTCMLKECKAGCNCRWTPCHMHGQPLASLLMRFLKYASLS